MVIFQDKPRTTTSGMTSHAKHSRTPTSLHHVIYLSPPTTHHYHRLSHTRLLQNSPPPAWPLSATACPRQSLRATERPSLWSSLWRPRWRHRAEGLTVTTMGDQKWSQKWKVSWLMMVYYPFSRQNHIICLSGWFKRNTRELGTLAFHHVISSLCIWNHSSCWFIFLPQPSLLPKCSKFPIVPSTPSLHSLQCSPTLDFHKVRHFQGPLPKLCPTTSTNGFGRSSQWMPWWLVKILQCQGPCGGHGMNSKGLEIGPAAKKSPTWGWWILELANTSYGAFVAFIMTGLGL